MRSPSGGGSSLTTLPERAGIGLRAPHHSEFLERRPTIGWLEVHSENFFGPGGEALALLQTLRADYPVSLHGVGLSLGSADALAERHLAKLKALVERIQPAAVSEHLCWSSVDGRFLNDLLPMPYTEEALAHMCRRVDHVQSVLATRLLIENLSSYLRFAASTIPEWEFLAELSRRTGCGLLLDVNNVHVSARNHGFDARAFIAALPPQAVGEIHLAGFETEDELLIDTHSRPVHAEVWALYDYALAHCGRVPTLIEWDNDLPPLDTLLAEAAQADARLAALEPPHARAA